ncbi:MAG: competence/damage-inducible protein A, partial [Rikenellaceae bacterium]
MNTVEIVTIGDEILIGQIVDTNSAWLGDKLSNMGMKVQQITSIGDTKSEIMNTLSRAISQNKVTFVTGGLGPTKDDITKHTLAEMFQCKLVKNEACYKAVEDLCARKGLDFNDLNKGQGYVPECCQAIVNDHGTAPAMIFERNGNFLVSLPGVPFEMKPLCEDKIFPFLKEKLQLE